MKKKDLYIIQCDKTGAFKIGISMNVQKRLKTLKTGCPYEIRLILHLEGRADLEKKLHKMLKKYRTSKGNQEWFSFDGMASLPDDIYEQFDLEVVNTWWEN